MQSNPYESPRHTEKISAARRHKPQKVLNGLSRLGIVLLVLSPVLYLSGIVIVFSADNMRPGKSRPRAMIGKVVWHSGTAAFWTGLGLLILPFCFPSRSEQ
jgi:hypothetical protein